MVESGGERRTRALAWMVVALLGLLVAGIVYLRPALTAPAERSVPRAVASRQVGAPVSFNVSFGDAEHGVLQVVSQLSQPNRPPPIYVTSDGGRTWKPLAKFTNPLAAVTFVDHRRMLAEESGSAPSLLISDDGGLSWQPLAADPRQFVIRGLWPVLLGSDGWWLDFQQVAGPGLQSSRSGRIWHTSDGGKSWTLLAAPTIPQIGSGGQLRFIDTRHGAMAVTLAGNQRLPAVVATENGGDSWQMTATFDTPLPGTRPFGILLLQHGARLLAWLTMSSWDFQTTGPPPGEWTVLSIFTSVSDDGGATWGPLRPGPVTTAWHGTPAMDDRTGRLLLLDGRRLWISEDDGSTWGVRVAAIPAGLVPTFIAAAVAGSVYAVAVRPSDVTVLGPPPAVLLRSSDGGIHWTEVHLPRLST